MTDEWPARVHGLENALTEQRVAADLQRAADEFETLATEGIDPATGQPFASAQNLLRVAVQRSVLAPSEGVLGVVDGRVRWAAQAGVQLRPEHDPEFTQAMVALKKGQLTEAPVKSQFGWHIIKLEDTREAEFPAFDDVKAQIVQRLEQIKLQQYQENLRKAAKTDYKFAQP